jgi:dipeptidyl aminopeptidase/acylaminoacyl peptidase
VDANTGAAVQVTFGDQGNDSEPQWSPDGTRIAYLTSRTDRSPMRGSELNVVSASGGAPVRLPAPESGLKGLRWSHDGRSLAYIGSIDEIAIPKIWITPADGGKFKLVSDAVTYPNEIEWTEDGSALYFTGAYHGAHPLFRLDIAGGKASELAPGVVIGVMDVHEAAGKIVYACTDYQHPADLFAADLNGKRIGQITHLNQKLLSAVALQPVERLPYKAADGWDIEALFVKPAGWQPGKTYPLILMIHGGPNGMFGVGWNHEAQAYAARGWAVLMTNPRGSSGYGEAFQRGVSEEWGGKAYQDIMAGVDAAIAKNPWIDKNRLGVTGQSFGGFMTDWIVGQTTRFKGAVTLSGISDLISVEGTRDGFYGHDRDFGGDLWQNFDLYWKYSPIRNAAKVKTPTLILHGESDQRVPIGQGEEFFRALYHFGVPTELVMFPREPHSLRSEPKHAVEVLGWQIYWFDRYVAGNSRAAKPGSVE